MNTQTHDSIVRSFSREITYGLAGKRTDLNLSIFFEQTFSRAHIHSPVKLLPVATSCGNHTTATLLCPIEIPLARYVENVHQCEKRKRAAIFVLIFNCFYFYLFVKYIYIYLVWMYALYMPFT